MSFWTAARVARVCGTPPAADIEFSMVSTDTRALAPGALFVALRGERYDAHAFLAEAQRRGATGMVVRKGTPHPEGVAVFEVDDTLVALGRLARERRRAVAGPVVAVTGTNGKTSTRQMLRAALATRWRVHATHENQNNLVGVPLTILATPADGEALVVEAGASVPGEIARLRDIIEPSVAVVTNVSPGHLQGFGSLQATVAEKVGLLEGVPLAVVGPRPADLAARAAAVAGRVVVAGLDRGAGVRPDQWELNHDGCPRIAFHGCQLRLSVLGSHQADNAMIALAVAAELALDLPAVARALEQVSLPPGRCQLLRHGDLVVVYDAYNANPASVAASLATVEAMRGGRRLVVALGSMLELGPDSEALHEEVAGAVVARRPDLIVVEGAFAAAFARHAARLSDRLLVADDADSMGRLLAARLRGDEVVLLKASRGVQLERAIPYLIPDYQRTCSTIS